MGWVLVDDMAASLYGVQVEPGGEPVRLLPEPDPVLPDPVPTSGVGSSIPTTGGNLVQVGTEQVWDGTQKEWVQQPKYQFVPARSSGGTSVSVTSNPAVDPSRAGAYDAAAANNMARAQSGLYDAQAALARAQAEGDAAKIAMAQAELEQRQRQFDLTTQENQARREQDAALARMASEQRAAEFGVGQTGYYGGAPTMEREKLISDAERQNLQLLASIGNQAAQIRLREIEQAESALQNRRQFGLQEGGLTGYYGGLDGQGRPTLARSQFELSQEQSRGAAALAGQRFGFEQEMGRGQLGLSTRQQGFTEEQGRGAAALAGQRFGLESELGRGGLDLQRQAQRWQQARDPFSATAKAQMLRGGDFGAAPTSRFSDMPAPGVRSVFTNETPGEVQSPLPWISAQDRNRLLPSEQRILGAEVQSRGIDEDDYWEQSRRLTATGEPPRAIQFAPTRRY